MLDKCVRTSYTLSHWWTGREASVALVFYCRWTGWWFLTPESRPSYAWPWRAWLDYESFGDLEDFPYLVSLPLLWRILGFVLKFQIWSYFTHVIVCFPGHCKCVLCILQPCFHQSFCVQCSMPLIVHMCMLLYDTWQCRICVLVLLCWYSKPCVKQPLKNRQNKDLNDKR